MADPVLSVAVDGGTPVSFELDQFCDGGKPVTCFGFGGTGDLFMSSFELSADPDPFVAGSIDFYNASLTDTISVDATILFPMSAGYAAAKLSLGTGIVTSVLGGGILDISIAAFIDDPLSPVMAIDELSPGVPFSVCDDLLADAGCQDSVLGLTAGPMLLGSVDILSAIGVQLSFDLTPDTSATIGLDPFEPMGGGAFFSITPVAVPVPPALALFASALGLAGALRRRRNC